MTNLSGQVAIITGASSGIGKGVALNLAEAGVNLVLTGRRQDRLDELANQIGTDRTLPLAADILQPDAPQKLIDAALEKFGRFDILFNGAGSMHVGTIENIDLDLISEMVRANFDSALRMAYTALKHFKKSDSGSLINVSSILGTKVRPGTGAYAGTKFGIEALTEALRMEVAGTNIRISALEPGVVETELQLHFEKHPKEVLGITDPLLPEDIARCVRFILEQPPHVRIPVMMVLPGQQAM